MVYKEVYNIVQVNGYAYSMSFGLWIKKSDIFGTFSIVFDNFDTSKSHFTSEMCTTTTTTFIWLLFRVLPKYSKEEFKLEMVDAQCAHSTLSLCTHDGSKKGYFLHDVLGIFSDKIVRDCKN